MLPQLGEMVSQPFPCSLLLLKDKPTINKQYLLDPKPASETLKTERRTSSK